MRRAVAVGNLPLKLARELQVKLDRLGYDQDIILEGYDIPYVAAGDS